MEHLHRERLKIPTDTAAMERLAQAVRTACVHAALEAYEQAGFDGLCAEGAWECAVSAMQSLDLTAVIQEYQNAESSGD